MIFDFILGIIVLVIILDLILLIVRAAGSSGADITSALCYVFGILPLPSLFVSVLFRLAEGIIFGVLISILSTRLV